jgi:O-antigen ligase
MRASAAALRDILYPHQPALQLLPARQNALLYGTFGLLLFGPLAFGAVEPWAILVLELGAVALVCLWAWQQAGAAEWQVRTNPLFPPMLAFAAVVLAQLVFGVSAYRAATVSAALLYVAYALLCFLAVQCVRRAVDVATVAWLLSVYGIVLALFATLQSLTYNGKLYWLRTPRSGGWIFGPYVNHNHYAGLMELLLPVPLVLCVSRRVAGGPKILLGCGAVLMASTVFLSGSRGGMAAVTVQVLLLAIYLGTRRKSPRTALALGGFAMAAAVLVIWLGGSTVADRLGTIHKEARTELTSGVRGSIGRDGLHMLRQRPILGWGLGTFPTVYPQFRSFYTNLFVNEAHNDYVQLLVETGGLGLAAAVWFLWALYRRGLTKLGEQNLGTNGAVALAGLLACSGILVHSWVDFNLQIPANAALFYVFAVLAAADPLTEPHRGPSNSRPAAQVRS